MMKISGQQSVKMWMTMIFMLTNPDILQVIYLFWEEFVYNNLRYLPEHVMKIWFEQQETEINEQNFPEQDLEK